MADSNILNFIEETQRDLFREAQSELQLSAKQIAGKAGIPYSTFMTYVNGATLSLPAIKRLLRVEGMAPFLSRLFEPEEYALTPTVDDEFDDTAAKCIDFAAEHAKARHPESECGVQIGPKETKRLSGKRAQLRAA